MASREREPGVVAQAVACCAVAIMAKAPLPGVAKTRLVPVVGEERAASLHRAFLMDTLAAAGRVPEADVYVVTPDNEQARLLRSLVPEGVGVLAQEGQGLMAGLDHALRELLARGHRAVALVDSDSPTLPCELMQAAFVALAEGADVVLGPSDDGGYYLIASARPLPRLFMADYHRDTICEQTAAVARQQGLNVRQLPGWYDVDEAADLSRLACELRQQPARAPHTAAELTGDFLPPPLPIPPPTEARWEASASEYLLESPWRQVRRDKLRLAGAETSYAYLEVPRAVFVVPVTAEGRVALVRQYRHPVRDWLWEVPAGSIEAGESSVDAAHRELAEEAGGSCQNLQLMASFYSSAAHMDLRGDYYLARGVELGAPYKANGEIHDVACIDLRQALTMARRGQIREGQSALALLLAEPLLRMRLGRR